MAKTGYSPTDPAVEQQLIAWRATSNAPEAPLRFRALGFTIKATIIALLILWIAGFILLLPFAIFFFPPAVLMVAFWVSVTLLAIRWMVKK